MMSASLRKSSTKTSCFFGCARLRRERVCTALMPDSVLSTYMRVQQRLVVAGLELVGTDQEAVRDPRWILSAIWPDGKLFSDASVTFSPPNSGSSGEGHDCPVLALSLLQVVANGMEVLEGALDAVGDHHRPRPRQRRSCIIRDDLLVEVVDHDLGLEADRVVVALERSDRSFFCAFLTSNSGSSSTVLASR